LTRLWPDPGTTRVSLTGSGTGPLVRSASRVQQRLCEPFRNPRRLPQLTVMTFRAAGVYCRTVMRSGPSVPTAFLCYGWSNTGDTAGEYVLRLCENATSLLIGPTDRRLPWDDDRPIASIGHTSHRRDYRGQPGTTADSFRTPPPGAIMDSPATTVGPANQVKITVRAFVSPRCRDRPCKTCRRIDIRHRGQGNPSRPDPITRAMNALLNHAARKRDRLTWKVRGPAPSGPAEKIN
jgi:hypothetical protein